MFAKGKHLIQPWASRSRYLYHLVKAGLKHQSHQTLCSCHRNSIFNHLLNPWRNKGVRPECQLNFARQLFFAVYSIHPGQERHHLHNKRPVYYNQHNNLNKPVGIMVFLRSLSSEPDSDGNLSTPIDVNVQDIVEGVDKELDAVVAGQRISRKGKNLSVNVSKDSMRSVGRLVPDKILNLLDEDGELLGSLRREEAIRRSQKSGLKLVLINSKSMPYPTYRLMTGKHLHEEQMLLREKLRKTSAPTQVKEVRLSGNIAKHDLEVKQRHMQGWLKEGETHVHARVTVMGGGKGQKKITKEQQMAVVHQLMSGMEDRVTFANKPRDFGKDGMNLSVVIRPMSAKEKATMVRQKNIEESMQQPEAVGNSSDEGEGVNREGRDEKVDG